MWGIIFVTGGHVMILSKNNIIIKIKSSSIPEYAILNPISGCFDIMNEKEYSMLKALDSEYIQMDEFSSYLLERGYAYKNHEDEEQAVNKAFKEFNEEVNQSQVQLMLVPTYGCNLACTYCFQQGVEGKSSLISKETVNAFFAYASKAFSDRNQKPFITLFGGEPLINSGKQREIIEYIVDKCAVENYELAVVTNGYDLEDYIDILKKAKIKEIQVTIDGCQKVHDNRRATKNKKGTFDRIVNGIEAVIKNGMPVNLRTVVDLENIEDLVELAEFLNNKGWLDLPVELFKTQIGRNYELFDCYAKPQHLMSQVELWSEFALLSKKYPILVKFHRPDFKGIRHLSDTGEMYMASFDTCPACKTEWVFDLYGNIYGCTASCGREEYLLGTYCPQVKLNNQAIETWQKRSVRTIPQCRICKYDVICGGGCGVIAANKNRGDILSPDCRPIKELIDIGVNYYINDIKSMSEETGSTELQNESCCITQPCSCDPKKKQLGCVICGRDLVYCFNAPAQMQCSMCGKHFESNVKCSDGHYVCDDCHGSNILGITEQFLINSSIQNPIELAEKVFELPGLNMHGPEYHSIVPAVILTAYQNVKGIRDSSIIKEAIRRGMDTKGGSCGFSGNCGAAVGAGIASSIMDNATPMSSIERGNANRATGYALLEISKYDGPRCCKREAILSIESFMQNTDYFRNLFKKKYICKQYKRNKHCIRLKCPYFPKKH